METVPPIDAQTHAVGPGAGPAVTGPITGPDAQWLTALVDLGSIGYVEEEYFILQQLRSSVPIGGPESRRELEL